MNRRKLPTGTRTFRCNPPRSDALMVEIAPKSCRGNAFPGVAGLLKSWCWRGATGGSAGFEGATPSNPGTLALYQETKCRGTNVERRLLNRLAGGGADLLSGACTT